MASTSATHRDLESMRTKGLFREDLFARLAGFEMALPALRDRLEDLGLLVSVLLRATGNERLSFDAAAVRTLAGHPWPHNVRELGAALAHAAALATDGVVALEHLPPTVRAWQPTATAPTPDAAGAAPGVRNARDARIRERLVDLLRTHNGNVAAVARALGKHRRQVHRWLGRFAIDTDDFRPRF
jgi:sigma-54 dependent transcriptional regulator, acetoin dehydrogenase operon transcriptional activator AcoR